MPLLTQQLQEDLISIFTAGGDGGSVEDIAAQLAVAIEAYIKSAEVTTPTGIGSIS